MTTAEVVTHSEGKVARPLSVLVPLIKSDLEQGKDAAERATLPYFRAAGEKFHEAKDGNGLTLPELYAWTQRNFNIGKTQTRLYMSFAATPEPSAAARVTSLDQFQRETLGRHRPTSGRVDREWRADVDALAEKARATQERVERLHQDNMTRQQEREAERALAIKLIDIGYKVLAKELHPDKGGSQAVMQRLVTVRDRLKRSA